MSLTSMLRRISRRTWLILSIAVVAATGTGIWVFGFLLPAGGDQSPATTRTATASRQTLEKAVTTTGSVTPAIQDDVSFDVAGTVTSVAVTAGDTVKKGGVLATVDKLQVNADLLDAKATLASARASLASAQDANDGSSAAQARVNAAAAAVDVAKASVSQAQAAMADTTLVAPHAGLVTVVNIAVGDRVSAGGSPTSGSSTSATSSSSATSAQFTIVSTDAWVVDATIGETDIANVKVGQQVALSTDDRKQLTGKVTQVGLLPSTTSGSAKYPVDIAVDGPGDGLFDGISVDVRIIYESRANVLTVPSAAVTTSNGVSTVIVVASDGTQTRRQVTVGETSGNLTEIVSGLSEGDVVLVTTFTPGLPNPGNQGNVPTRFPGRGQFPGGGGFPTGFPRGGGQGGFPGGNP